MHHDPPASARPSVDMDAASPSPSSDLSRRADGSQVNDFPEF
jgi:hypothetical protein